MTAILGALSALVLFVTIHFYFAMAIYPGWLRRLSRPTGKLSWAERLGIVYFIMGLVGSATLVYLGVERMLWWIPADWGTVGEDGFVSYRTTFAIAIAMCSFFITIIIFEHVSNKEKGSQANT